MERLWKSRVVSIAIITLLFLFILYMLVLIRPLLYGFFQFAKDVGVPFVVALIISYLLHPIVNAFVRWGVRRALAVLFIYLIFFVGIGILIYQAIPILIIQFKELSEHLPMVLKTLDQFLAKLQSNQDLWPEGIQKGIEDGIYRMEETLSLWVTQLVDGIGGLMKNVTTYLLIPFIAFYMLKDFDHFHQRIVRFFPRIQRKKFILLLRDINEGLGNYIRGQLIVASFVGIFAYLGYLLIGLPYPMVFGIIAMVFNIIPYVGPFLSAAPTIVIAFTVSWKMALYVAIINIVLQFVEGNLLSPLIVGRSTHIHPLAIIFAILIGGKLGGIAGLILAVPMLVTLKVIFYHVVHHYLKDGDVNH